MQRYEAVERHAGSADAGAGHHDDAAAAAEWPNVVADRRCRCGCAAALRSVAGLASASRSSCYEPRVCRQRSEPERKSVAPTMPTTVERRACSRSGSSSASAGADAGGAPLQPVAAEPNAAAELRRASGDDVRAAPRVQRVIVDRDLRCARAAPDVSTSASRAAHVQCGRRRRCEWSLGVASAVSVQVNDQPIVVPRRANGRHRLVRRSRRMAQ